MQKNTYFLLVFKNNYLPLQVQFNITTKQFL